MPSAPPDATKGEIHGEEIRDRRPTFEALALTVDPGPRETPRAVVTRVAGAARLGRWRVDTVDAERGQFELVPPVRSPRPDPGAAWDAVYRLRAQPQVVYAEPPAAEPAADDLAAQIGRLADLKAQGVLSDEEFEAAKAKLISG